jgi:hypothetical protein
MILGLLLACDDPGIVLTPAEEAELRELQDQAKAQAEPLEAARKATMQATRGKIGPRPDLGACPMAIRRPADDDAGSFADEGVSFALGTVPINVVHAKDLGVAEGPRYDRVTTALVNDVQSMLFREYSAKNRQEIDDGLARARQLLDPKWLAVDGTLIIDQEQLPAVTGTTFTPGVLKGRFYVYDYASQAIVCAASVWATNSDNIGVHTHLADDGTVIGADSDLVRDLYRQGVQNGIDGLAKAGPMLLAIE